MDWFLYDNGLRHERVKSFSLLPKTKNKQSKNFFPLFNDSKCFEGYLYKTTQHLSMRWKRETWKELNQTSKLFLLSILNIC